MLRGNNLSRVFVMGYVEQYTLSLMYQCGGAVCVKMGELTQSIGNEGCTLKWTNCY